MRNSSLSLYLEINTTHFIFFVGKSEEEKNFEVIYKLELPISGITNSRISDLENFFNILKENVYLIEQKFDHTFKEIILILDNFNIEFINLTGFKKLNGSQILRENITYILNNLKSCVDEIEKKKKVLHIFNSKFYLDNKKIENLPIGLFGDFYSHELSFFLMNKNDYKNLKNIFDKCNLMIKKILVKSFLKGSSICNKNSNLDTFFYIKIEEKNSKILYFENNSLKIEESFNFGFDILIKDISKITSLKTETIINILTKIESFVEIKKDDYLEKEFFDRESYKKIKKKLIYDIALARLEELSEIFIFKNINFKYYKNFSKNVFFELNSKFTCKFFKENIQKTFSQCGKFTAIFSSNTSDDSIIKSANEIVHFGWKTEAIHISKSKKSIISRFFEKIFN